MPRHLKRHKILPKKALGTLKTWTSTPKIYDLILINTELEWLEIRMGQMADQVDYFIIIEADKTFTNAKKPLHVLQNWNRFKTYHHKMIRHKLNMSGVMFKNTCAREKFSRNAMYDQVMPYLTGTQKAFPGDVILVSDVDEIPQPDTLKTLRNCNFPKEVTVQTKMYTMTFNSSEAKIGHVHKPPTTMAQTPFSRMIQGLLGTQQLFLMQVGIVITVSQSQRDGG